MHNQNQPLNQTQFSFEEPIFENPLQYEEEKPPVVEKSKKSKKKLYITIGIVVTVFLLLILFVIFLRLRNRNDVTETLKRDPAIEQELGPLQRRIEQSRFLLESADPTKEDLSFPPVNFDLRLDPKED